jgi:hypothetical protein
MNNTRDYLLSPVDLRIYQDWAPALSFAETLINKSKTNYSDIRPAGNVNFYDMGLVGSVGHHIISDHWYIVSGAWMRKHLKWLDKLIDDMAEIEPDPTITFARSDVTEHIDIAAGPTALNYPIFTADAETWVRDKDGKIYSYPSNANKPWLLHTHQPHGITVRDGYRVALGMHFSKEYPVVRAWFDNHPNLVYGE